MTASILAVLPQPGAAAPGQPGRGHRAARARHRALGIGEGPKTGAGAVVTCDVAAGTTVIGIDDWVHP